MKKIINLYNHFHNGDLFFSRGIINQLIKEYDVKVYHDNKTPIFNDIPQVEEICGIPLEFSVSDDNSEIYKKNLINTWIGQGGFHYLHAPPGGCTFENYIIMFKDISKYLNLTVNDDTEYLPTVNFENLPDIEELKNKILSFKNDFKKIILISNGDVLSEQSSNFDFTSIIDVISNEYPDYLFILTKKTNLNKTNIVYTDIITNKTPDLLYISFISLFCNVIIGRNSGPYCFTQFKENLLDENKKYICFSHNPNAAIFYSKSKVDFIWSHDYNLDNVINTIKNNLK